MMKKLLYLVLITLVFTNCDDDTPEPSLKSKTEPIQVSMGEGYTNDVYYSLANGIVSTESRTEWDIAFSTNIMSSTIITNDGNGTELYVADAIANWDNVTEIPTSTVLYNTYSDTTWEHGAFDKGVFGDWDYGWGSYDMATHTVSGDSVHVIVLANGTPKKLIIEKRDGVTYNYHIKYANLDGSDEISAEIPCADYTDKNFIHYSIQNNSIVEHEPDAHKWDLMFTKYYDESIPYKVTGILGNNDLKIAEVNNADTASNEYASATYSKVINTIGSDWKSFDMEAMKYAVSENLVYFAQDKNGKYYKLVFTGFDMATGNVDFVKTTYIE